MKVRAKIAFNDLLEKKSRENGEEFEVTKERYEEILSRGGDWIELIDEELEDGQEGTDFTKLKRAELEEIARKKGIAEDAIKEVANKTELIKLIRGKA